MRGGCTIIEHTGQVPLPKDKMNQRIRELANIWANRRAEDEKLGIVYTFSEPALEQFAELIVRECIDIAQDRANFPGFPPNDVNDIIDEIREHFGVEE